MVGMEFSECVCDKLSHKIEAMYSILYTIPPGRYMNGTVFKQPFMQSLRKEASFLTNAARIYLHALHPLSNLFSLIWGAKSPHCRQESRILFGVLHQACSELLYALQKTRDMNLKNRN